MKTVIASIHADYVQAIFSGEKWYEIRKSAPKPPFYVWIYETKKRRPIENIVLRGRGMIVGKFTVEKVEEFTTDYRADNKQIERIQKGACLTMVDLVEYKQSGRSPCLYAWHISDVRVFKYPRKITDFVGHPPQSYCYARRSHR